MMMLNFLKAEANRTYTENGAVTNATTGSDCLDLFATVGALRGSDYDQIADRFKKAYIENPDLAMKLFFYARDIRGGLGERKVFRDILRWLSFNHSESVYKNMNYIAEFGRFDDMLTLMDTPCERQMISHLKVQFEEDMKQLQKDGNVSLLGKWLPSVNASNERTVCYAKKIARAFGMKEKEYRQALTALRAKIAIVENSLRKMEYTFDYSCLPSKALFKYRKAFCRNDLERYEEFLDYVAEGKEVLNASTISPYELVAPYLDPYNWSRNRRFMKEMSEQEKKVLNATWNSLPEFGKKGNALAVIDTSGSMYSCQGALPAAVALSLGLYFAEHNTGHFKNHFITFSGHPQMVELKGKTFVEKLEYVTSMTEVANTNLEAVFDLVLFAAARNRVKQRDLPETLYIISDMEFDACVEDASATIFENAKRKFAVYGYKLPKVVFWNVASRNKQQPVTMNEQGVALVSGVTPRIFSMVTGGEISPYKVMMDVLGAKRYQKIVA